MSVRWRLEYIDDFGHNIRTDISEPDYEGPIIPVDGVGYSPVQIAIESQNDRKEKVIKGTSIEVSMFSMSDFQFQDISEGTERQFVVRHYQDDVLKHAGFVIPEVYSEPYKQPPYPVTIRATSIGSIKNQPYKSTITPINASLLSVIRQCISTAPLITSLWESIDITHEGQVGNTLEDIRINESAFLETQRGRVKWRSKHDVLEEVLKPFGVNFFQDFGRWVIVPFDKRTQPRTVRQYGLLVGGVQSTFTHDPEIASFDFVNVNHNLDKQPAASSILCTYEHGVSPTFATGFNDDFQQENWGIQQSTELPQGWSLITQPGSGSDFTGQRFLSPDLGGPGVLFFEGNAFFDGIEFTRSNFLRNSVEDTISVNFRFATFVSGQTTSETSFQIRIGDYYLLSDGSWTTTESNIVFEDVNRFFPAGGVSSAYSDFDLESSPIPEEGDFRARKFSSIEDQNLDRQIFVYFDVVHNPEGRPQPQSTSFIGERDIDSFSKDIDIQTQYGDAPSILHENTFIFDGSQTNDWNRGDQSGTLQEILIQSVSDEYQFPISLINGTFKIDGLFDVYLNHKGKKYILNGGRYTERQGYFDGQIIESGLGASNISSNLFVDLQTSTKGSVSQNQTSVSLLTTTNRAFNSSQKITETTVDISGVVTSIPILPIDKQFLSVGDPFYVFNLQGAELIEFTLSEPQLPSASNLIVESVSLDNTIVEGSWIIFTGEQVSNYITRSKDGIRLGVRSYSQAITEDGDSYVDQDGNGYVFVDEGDQTAINQGTTAEIAILQGEIVLKATAGGNLALVRLDAKPESGSLITIQADNINLQGLVTAINSGGSETEIDGGKIKADTSVIVGTGDNIAALTGAHATVRMYAGNADPAAAPFRVLQDGSVIGTKFVQLSGETVDGVIEQFSIKNLLVTGALTIGTDGMLRTSDDETVFGEDGIQFSTPENFTNKNSLIWASNIYEDSYISGFASSQQPLLEYKSRQHRFRDDENNTFMIMNRFDSTSLGNNIQLVSDTIIIDGTKLPNSRSAAGAAGGVYVVQQTEAAGDYWELRIRRTN